MVLPEPTLGRQVLAILWTEGEGHILRINGNRTGASIIDPDSNHFLRREIRITGGLSERFLNSLLDPSDVVGRVLAGQVMILRVEENSLMPRRIIINRGAELRAICHPDDEGSHRVGAVINAYAVCHLLKRIE